MRGKRFILILILALFFTPTVNAEGWPDEEDLSAYLISEQTEHMKALSYRSIDQFLSLAETNSDMLCDELEISEEELEQMIERMPGRSFGSVDLDELPLMPIDYEPRIVGYEELLEEDYSSGGADVNLISDCPSIRDQGRRGTCVAFASVAFLEYEYINNIGEDSHLDLSEQFFFWACKQKDGQPDVTGTWVSVAADVLQEDGTCLESTWPYNPEPDSDPGQGPPPKGAVEEAQRYTFSDIDYCNDSDIDELIDSLEDEHIVVFAVPIYKSWYESAEVHRTGEIPMPLKHDEVAGGHAMNLVGCKDDESYSGGGYFILRNSWGDDWAEESQYGAGYGTIPYAYIYYYWKSGWIAD